MFKRNLFKESTAAASEVLWASLAFNSLIFWNFWWIISSQWDLIRSCYIYRYDKQVISFWVWFIASWTSTQRQTYFCCTWAYFISEITRSHFWDVCDTHLEHLKDSELTQHEKKQDTHFLQDHIVLVTKIRLLTSLQ